MQNIANIWASMYNHSKILLISTKSFAQNLDSDSLCFSKQNQAAFQFKFYRRDFVLIPVANMTDPFLQENAEFTKDELGMHVFPKSDVFSADLLLSFFVHAAKTLLYHNFHFSAN